METQMFDFTKDKKLPPALAAEMLRGLSLFFSRAADIVDDRAACMKNTHGPGLTTMSYDVEWVDCTAPWASDSPLQD
jgi:hypothetical protein